MKKDNFVFWKQPDCGCNRAFTTKLSSEGKMTPRTDEMSMREILAEQRNALKNSSSYYAVRDAILSD